MSTCKDCLHNDVCHFTFKGCELTEEEKKDCGFFKPKTDYVEVVRCKDCKHQYTDPIGQVWCILRKNQELGRYVA